MPEIAEVETVRRVLRDKILNHVIKRVEVFYDGIIESNVDEFKTKLVGEKFIDISRVGKWLIFETNNYYLVSHLRMEGKYFIKPFNDKIEKHEHIVFYLDDFTLRYHDVRKFGVMHLLNKDELSNYEGIKKQGLEIIDPKLTGKYIYDKIHKSNKPIKTMLLDQTIISGLGNIYVDEVLFASGILPTRDSNKVTLKECDSIVKEGKRIIEKAIECGGTTIRSYTSSLGVTGTYQDYLMVHKNAGKKCKTCGTIILKERVGGRGTYYCSKCQK